MKKIVNSSIRVVTHVKIKCIIQRFSWLIKKKIFYNFSILIVINLPRISFQPNLDES